MSCDKTQNIPTGLQIVLQTLSDDLNALCMCWRVNDVGANSISTTVVDPLDIVHNKGGIIDMDGARWAIYPYDMVAGNNPADLEKYIYTGSSPANPVASHQAAKITLLKNCFTAKAQPKIFYSKEKKNKSSIIRGNLDMPFIGLRASHSNRKANWYKQAQASGFNPESLNNPNNLSSMTKEQLDAAKSWVESQDGWLTNSWSDAQQPAVEIIENDAKFNALKEKAPSSADRAAATTTSMEGFNKIIAKCSSMKSSIENDFMQLGTDVKSACPFPSTISKPNIDSVESIRNLYSVVQMNFLNATMAFLKIRAAGSSAERAPSVEYVCQAYHSISQAIDMQAEARTYLESIISNPSHDQYKMAISFLSESNKDAGKAPEKINVGLVAG